MPKVYFGCQCDFFQIDTCGCNDERQGQSNIMTSAATLTSTLEKKDFVIDVGANLGDFALEVASRNPNIQVLAIEPIPALCRKISEIAESRLIKNVAVLNVAINTDEKIANFYVSDHDDSGVSSLLEFDLAKIKDNQYWNSRSDLYFDRTINVSVKRLESILDENNVNCIRFIKIDAQGVDLNVLKSLGKYLQITDAGMLEVPATLNTTLYRDEHDLQYALKFISEGGFNIYAVKPNDHAANEYNVFFCRKGLDYRDVELNLRLCGISLYDGKHFWHFPSNKWQPIEARLNEAESTLQRSAQLEADLHAEHAESSRLRAALEEERAESIRLRGVEAALHAEHAESTRLRAALEETQSRVLGLLSEVQYLRSLYIVRAWFFARQILNSLFRRS